MGGSRRNFPIWDKDGNRTPEWEARLEERRKKRAERDQSKLVKIKLDEKDARRRVSASSLAKSLGVGLGTLKKIIPQKRKTLGWIVRKLNSTEL